MGEWDGSRSALGGGGGGSERSSELLLPSLAWDFISCRPSILLLLRLMRTSTRPLLSVLTVYNLCSIWLELSVADVG